MSGRVLVTGATGFIGRHLCARLAKEGTQVHAVVRPGSRRETLGATAICHVHDGSTRSLADVLDAVQPDIVFHVASTFLARHGADDVEPLVRSNVLFGTQLLESMSERPTARLLNVGTTWQHYEGKPYGPVNLYAATKQAFEDIAAYYHCARGAGVLTLELSDTYGPGDTRRKLFNLLHEAQASGRPLRMSPGLQEIDLVHVADVVSALLRGAELLVESAQPLMRKYQVSSGNPRPLREVVAMFESATGARVPVEWGALPYREREMMTAWAGEGLPGWRPAVSLEDGLRRMAGDLRSGAGA